MLIVKINYHSKQSAAVVIVIISDKNRILNSALNLILITKISIFLEILIMFSFYLLINITIYFIVTFETVQYIFEFYRCNEES